jgi:hypothetical protein
LSRSYALKKIFEIVESEIEVKKEMKTFQLTLDSKFSRTQEEVGMKVLHGHDTNER